MNTLDSVLTVAAIIVVPMVIGYIIYSIATKPPANNDVNDETTYLDK